MHGRAILFGLTMPVPLPTISSGTAGMLHLGGITMAIPQRKEPRRRLDHLLRRRAAASAQDDSDFDAIAFTSVPREAPR